MGRGRHVVSFEMASGPNGGKVSALNAPFCVEAHETRLRESLCAYASPLKDSILFCKKY